MTGSGIIVTIVLKALGWGGGRRKRVSLCIGGAYGCLYRMMYSGIVLTCLGAATETRAAL